MRSNMFQRCKVEHFQTYAKFPALSSSILGSGTFEYSPILELGEKCLINDNKMKNHAVTYNNVKVTVRVIVRVLNFWPVSRFIYCASFMMGCLTDRI